MLSASRKGPAFKPQLRVCYLCGQQFGNASIGIHIPQCYAKKVSQWEVGDPATRGRRPKHPDTVNWKGGDGVSKDKLNDDQFHEFTSNLVPCQRCGRKFLPDRLVVHLRGCKGEGGRSASRGKDGGGGGGAAAAADSRAGGRENFNQTTSSARSIQEGRDSKLSAASEKKSTSKSPARTPGYRPVLPICYLCGQQFGSSSIAIHVPQCYAKKLGQWEAADVNTRGKPPKHPSTVNWMGNDVSTEEHNDAQFAEFVSNLEPCPNCGRRFLSDRLVVHLRSCKPGSSSKPPPQSLTAAVAANTAETQKTSAKPGAGNAGCRPAKTEDGPPRPSTRSSDINGIQTSRGATKLSPKTNRLPKSGGNVDPNGRTCPRCSVVEYDVSAKYCRDCGTNLESRTLPTPCVKCGEQIPEGSRFCGTCGVPINGAVADERTPGVENVNAPTIRVLVCPACKAVCDADGNFCDNCGGALGDVEPSVTNPVKKEVMFCGKCRETVEELTSRFCEECGGVLEKICVNTADGAPHERSSTLDPDTLKLGTTPKIVTVAPRITTTPTTKEAAASPSVPLLPSHIRGSLASPTPQKPALKSQIARESQDESVTTAKQKDCKASQSSTRNTAPPQDSAYIHPEGAPMESQNMDNVTDVGERVQCGNCGRKFAVEALERHERVCAAQKKRKVFNMREVRATGCDETQVAKATSKQSAAPVAKKDWRAESEAFRRSMREARLVDKVLKSGGNARDLPPPTYSENSHYTPCPHCGRKFAADVAERHIPRCATTVNKPKPPPRRR